MPGGPRKASHDEDSFLEQLSCRQTTRSSARSHSSRHSWRPGFIPPCLELPHRIPSHFPVPAATVAQVPGLNHPDLSRGQRRYLHSTAQIYSMEASKRALSDSYYGLLMSELLRGGGARDSHKRYTIWIYGNHKRLYETDPKIWRSSSQEVASEDSAAESGRPATSSRDSDQRPVRSERRQAVRQTDKQDPAITGSTGDSGDANATADKAAYPDPSRRHARPDSADARGRRTRLDNSDERGVVVVAASQSSAARPRSARKSAQSRGDSARVGHIKGGSADENADGQRPRDLSKIMY